MDQHSIHESNLPQHSKNQNPFRCPIDVAHSVSPLHVNDNAPRSKRQVHFICGPRRTKAEQSQPRFGPLMFVLSVLGIFENDQIILALSLLRMTAIPFLPHLFSLSLVLLTSVHASGQTKTTTTFHASGCCPWCQENIEQSLQINGVIRASWDQFSETATVRFKTRQHSDSSLQKRVALAGHDTSLFLAPDSCYYALPKCCHYRNEMNED